MPHTDTAAPTQPGGTFIRSDYVVLVGEGLAVALAAVTHFVGGGAALPFLCSAVAVTLLASLVGRAVEQLGTGSGPVPRACSSRRWATFPSCSSRCSRSRPAWSRWCQAALIGSILANLLLVLGWPSSSGGLKHGTQQLDSERARSIVGADGALGGGHGGAVPGALRAHPRRRTREDPVPDRLGWSCSCCSPSPSRLPRKVASGTRRAPPARGGRLRRSDIPGGAAVADLAGCRAAGPGCGRWQPSCRTGSSAPSSRRWRRCTSATPSQVW